MPNMRSAKRLASPSVAARSCAFILTGFCDVIVAGACAFIAAKACGAELSDRLGVAGCDVEGIVGAGPGSFSGPFSASGRRRVRTWHASSVNLRLTWVIETQYNNRLPRLP